MRIVKGLRIVLLSLFLVSVYAGVLRVDPIVIDKNTGDCAYIQTKYAIVCFESCPVPKLDIDVDRLLERVCELMPGRLNNPSELPRLYIQIFKTRQEVRIAYLKITKSWKDIPAFYEDFILPIIYISQEDLREGILAHEMAHFIMCRGCKNIPDRKTQETWARYVEMQIIGDLP